MSTSTPKKPPSTSTPSRMAPSNTSTPSGTNRSPSRASAASAASPSTVSRARSVRGGSNTPISARSAVKKPNAPGGSNYAATADANTEEDSRAETVALISDLEERLQRTEDASSEYRKQIEVLQTRLDEAIKEQAKMEERLHEEEERLEGLANEKREVVREKRELENIYEAERVAAMKEKEGSQVREEELLGVINRLRERQKEERPPGGLDDDDGRLSRNSSYGSRSSTLEAGHFAPHSSLQRSNSRSDSKLILQKDKVIESLRLELAEAQIKLVEMENAGGGRVRELERILLETRMTNARLMEDNESYQLLLSEKTLNGDFSKGEFMRHTIEERAPSRAGPSGTSLADELQSFADDESEHVRRLEAEVKSLADEKKALTLYINKIIERLLQHSGFESILSNTPEPPSKPRVQPHADKELPPPPPQEGQASFLQRAKSVLGSNPRARPVSMIPAVSGSMPGVTEDPGTAPSIPLQRSYTQRASSGTYSHKRSNSEWGSAATIVNNMYRSPAPDGSPGVVSPRNSIFMQAGRAISGGSDTSAARPESMSSVSSDAQPRASEDGGAFDTPSPPRSIASSGDKPVNAVMAGKTIRPLRLVQEKTEEDARKAANRGSWLGGWFKGSQAGSGAENQPL